MRLDISVYVLNWPVSLLKNRVLCKKLMYLRQVIVEEKNGNFCGPVEVTLTDGQNICMTNDISLKHPANKLILKKLKFLSKS